METDFASYFSAYSLNQTFVVSANQELRQKSVFYSFLDVCFMKDSTIAQRLRKQPLEAVFSSQYLIIESNCPLFVWIVSNSQNHRKLIDLGLLPNETFEKTNPSIRGFQLLSFVVRNFIHFNDSLIREADRQASQWRGSPSVAFHIRQGDRKMNIEHDCVFLDDRDIMSFVNCSVFQELRNALMFVASDSASAKQLVLQANPGRRVFLSPIQAHHSQASFQRIGTEVKEAIVELLTISSCDVIIGTWLSTFSLLAGALQGSLPHFVAKNHSCFVPVHIEYCSVFKKHVNV